MAETGIAPKSGARDGRTIQFVAVELEQRANPPLLKSAQLVSLTQMFRRVGKIAREVASKFVDAQP